MTEAWWRSADFQTCWGSGIQHAPTVFRRAADLEVGDSADLEICATRYGLRLLHRCQHALRRHGQLEQPRARAVVYRVGDHRAHEDDGRLAAALRWRVLGLDEDGLNLRHPREARQFIRVEVVVQDLAVLDR